MARRTSITALCLLLAVVGCTTPDQDGAKGSRGPITFVDGRDTTSGNRVAELVALWNEAHGADEQVTFTQMPASTDAHRAQLIARAQDLANDRDRDAHESSCYDVMMLDVLWTAAFAKAGYLEQLDPAEFDADRVLPRALAAATIDRRLWAIPGRTDVGLLYYRKDLVPVPPKTWDELIPVAKTVASKEGIHGYVGQFAQYEGLIVNAMEAVWANGGDALGADGSTVTINAPEAKAGIKMLTNGFADGWIPKEAAEFDEEASRKDFQQGNAVFMRNWAYAYASLDAPDSPVATKFAVAALPGPSALGGWNLAVSRCSTHQRTAWEFIRFYTKDDNQRALFVNAGMAPVLRSLYADEDLRRRYPYLRVLGESVDYARNRPSTEHYDQLSSVMQGSLHNALTNPRSADSTLERLAEAMAAALKGR